MSSLPSVPSPLSPPAVAVQQSRNATKNNLWNNWGFPVTSQWSASEMLRITLRFQLFSPRALKAVDAFVTTTGSWCLELRRLDTVQISKADIWFPGRRSHVKCWHINWAECMHVNQLTLSECTESLACMNCMCAGSCSHTAGCERHRVEPPHFFNDPSSQ